MALGDSSRSTTKTATPAKAPSPYKLAVRRSSAGLGLFALEPIPKGKRVIEYVGNLLTEAEYQKSRSVYLFDIGPSGALDGAPRWNLARYINHSCVPNCEPDVIRRRVFISSKRNIKAGEELSYNYGSEYFDESLAGRCRCPKCAPEAHGKAPRASKATAKSAATKKTKKAAKKKR